MRPRGLPAFWVLATLTCLAPYAARAAVPDSASQPRSSRERGVAAALGPALISDTEAAAQRGTGSPPAPAPPLPGTAPTIRLWDELKPSSGAAQSGTVTVNAGRPGR